MITKPTSKKSSSGLTQVATNAFIGKKEQPTEDELTTALGPAKRVWDRLLHELAQEYGVLIPEWKCYSVKSLAAYFLLNCPVLGLYIFPV